MIKPIDEIPKNVSEQRESYRQMIKNDIQEAMSKGIEKFEFIGNYNFKYLAQYAREEAENIVRSKFFTWKKDHPEYNERLKYYSYWEINRDMSIIKISSVKGATPDTRRVFCAICQDIDKAFAEWSEQQIKKHEEYERRKQMKNDT